MKKAALTLILIIAISPTVLSGAKAVQLNYGQFEGLPYEQPVVVVSSPSQNGLYTVSDVALNVTVQISGSIYHNIERVKWLNYSLDGQTAIPMAFIVPSEITKLPYPVYGNAMLTGLANGTHNLTIYGKTAIDGLAGTFNETVSFTVDTLGVSNTESFPILPFVAAFVVAVVVGACLLLYFRKRRRQNSPFAEESS